VSNELQNLNYKLNPNYYSGVLYMKKLASMLVAVIGFGLASSGVFAAV